MYYNDYIKPNPNEKWKELEIKSEKFKVSFAGRVQLLNGMITQGFLNARYFQIG